MNKARTSLLVVFPSLFLVVNASALAATCQKAEVSVGGGDTTTEYFCSDNHIFTDYPNSKYQVLTPDSGGGPAVPLPPQANKAICGVNKYTNPSYKIKANYQILFLPAYGFENSVTGVSELEVTNTPPDSSGHWFSIAGFTTDPADVPPYMTNILYSGYHPTATKTAVQEMIITLAHEAAHENGVTSEDAAEAIGAAALAAYNADGGAKCK